MAVKIKDIAKLAQVSEATVSLALNDNPLVKGETRERIKKLARELGYMPNAMARGLAKNKSGTIGVIVPDIENAYYGKLVRCIDENVKEAGYNMVLAISNDKEKLERQIIESFISQRVEGIIIAPMNQFSRDLDYIKELERHEIPYVFVTAYYPGIDSSFVMVDLEEGMYKLAKYLLDLGHRDIIFLSGFKKALTTDSRISGYMKAFDERGISVNDKNLIECRRINYQGACEVTEMLLESRRNIDAIITINDIMALGVLNILKSRNISVPGEISLAGYDNVIFSSISSVAITTVNQDIERMSLYSVNMLFNKIKEDRNINEKILIKPDLIIRESTGLKNIK